MTPICRFTHATSLVCQGDHFRIIGSGPEGADDRFNLNSPMDGPIVGAANLDEGLCHILLERGAILEVRADPDTVFKIQWLSR